MTERPRRFTRSHPCPICGGHDGLGADGVSAASATSTLPAITPAAPARNGQADCGRTAMAPTATGCAETAGAARSTAIRSSPRPTQAARPAAASPPQSFRSYFTLAAFLRRMYGEGAAVTSWPYHDAEGREAFRVLRVDHQDAEGTRAKTYRPCHQASDGRWRLSKPGGLLPLYNLPAVLATPPGGIVAVLEGEKCADIAAGLDLPSATTSAHGAQAPAAHRLVAARGQAGRHPRRRGRGWRGVRHQGRRAPGRPCPARRRCG